MLLVLLDISTSTSGFADNEIVNAENYKRFLINNVLNTSKQLQRTQESGNKMVIDQKLNEESPYERFIRNLRSNWEMPMDYLQERGYLKDVGSSATNTKSDLSKDAYNLINGPSLNPSTSRIMYPSPYDQNSLLSIRTDRQLNDKLENE